MSEVGHIGCLDGCMLSLPVGRGRVVADDVIVPGWAECSNGDCRSRVSLCAFVDELAAHTVDNAA